MGVCHFWSVFDQKNCWTLSMVWAGAHINHSSWNGQTCWKSLQKNSLKPNAASHKNASWFADKDGFLEHSPSRGSLYYKIPACQKIFLFFLGGVPLLYTKPQLLYFMGDLRNQILIWQYLVYALLVLVHTLWKRWDSTMYDYRNIYYVLIFAKMFSMLFIPYSLPVK